MRRMKDRFLAGMNRIILKLGERLSIRENIMRMHSEGYRGFYCESCGNWMYGDGNRCEVCKGHD